MSFKANQDEKTGIFVIECPPRIDVNVSDQLRDLISHIIEEQNYRIVLNLAETKYIDSSGLGAIVSRISVLRSNNGDIKLAAPKSNVTDLLKLTHLDKIITTYADIRSAMSGFTM